MKVLTVIGTRPEAIKMAPVVKELGKYPDEIRLLVLREVTERLEGVAAGEGQTGWHG